MSSQGFESAGRKVRAHRRGLTVAWLLTTTALVALSVTGPATAAEKSKATTQVAQAATAQTSIAQAQPRRTVSIPAQPLSSALVTFATQFSVEVSVDSATTAGVQAQAVSGSFTAEEALSRLLAGTGVGGRFTSPRAVALAKAGAGGPTTLGVISVEGRTLTGGAGAVDGYVAGATRTATKTDTPLRDIPQSITVVTQDQMKDLAVQNLTDVIRYVPGMTPHQGENNRDQVIIRGNSSSADYFLDGVRDDVQYYRDLYNIDRVEALKGPNAMIFGRGGSGGLINRVSKEADGQRVREVTLQGGSYSNMRGAFDVGDAINEKFAFRLNGVYEDTDTFVDHDHITRAGINPTGTVKANDSTTLKFGFEHFIDNRTQERGIPSRSGRPAPLAPETFVGNPNLNWADAEVNALYGSIEHEFSNGIELRNYTRYAAYDRKYQNIYATSAVNTATNTFTLGAYNNATQRNNVTNQTDVTGKIDTSFGTHKLLGGVELTRQESESFRNTGFFNNTATSITVSTSNTVNFTPVVFRQSATDADNRSIVGVAAAYAQDQWDINRWVSVIGGLRFDNFDLDYLDKRTNTNLSRTDDLVSPRIGVVVKPWEPVSLYANYSMTYLPSAGDQFATLTTAVQALKPEEIRNYEVGAKWDVRPDLSLNAAIFQLDRENTRAVDPTDPTRFVLTGASRTKGAELSLTGRITPQWQVIGAYAYQDAKIVKTTSAAAAGQTVALVPEHTFALWNRYDFTPMWGAGLGVIHQTDQFATVANTVTLPSYTRADAAIFFTLNPQWKAQLNVENIFDERYFTTADNNDNLTFGAPRTFRLILTAKF